jgi:hypothetical protein
VTEPHGVVETGGTAEHVETVIGPELAGLAARRTIRDELTRPRPLGVLGLEIVVAIAFLVTGKLWWIGLVLLLGVPVIVGLQLLGIPRLTRTLRETGYAAGSRLAVDYYADRFVLQAHGGQNTIFYGTVTRLRTSGRLAVLERPDAPRLVLPVEVVPPSVRPYFRKPD